jgi:Tol biopolymer transport system component
MRRISGTLAAILALATLGAGPLAAQFGQNKVQYRTFDFKIIQTEHFEVYYYPEERAAALDAARMAERGYARLSRILHHQFQGRKPIILYASGSDFQQTNVTDVGGESVGGVTEFFKHRMVLPFTGSYAELEHVLQHEMTHQFQFDVYSRGRPGGGVQTLVSVNPPLWFMEGMAEYLSLGPINPETAMWLRDASLEGHLPTIEELQYGDIFPYRYGHAIWAYIGEKWGDEVIGEILQSSATSGVEAAFKRALGLSLDELSADWRDAVQTTFLPQLGEHYRARRVAQATLTRKGSRGRIFLAPALTPDGREMAFFGDQGGFFIDLFLADAETGRVKRRLVKSTLNKNYESLRFINSAGTFSPDGRYFALAAKRRDRDDLVILDVKRGGREERRIKVNLNGLQTPSWSPDGRQLVFTGFDGGLSDLYIVNRDGTGLRRLTNDKYADLHPAWSPDGKTIAFVTDRGSDTDFEHLRFGNLRVALFHLDAGTIELLGHMEEGKNINPVWAPDGQSLAFVSDRTGISDIYLYDLTDGNIYQLTDLYTGVQGITPLSPVMTWARQADRLAFVYYEDGQYSVYSIENPRSLRRNPFRGPAVRAVTSLVAARPTGRDTTGRATPGVGTADPARTTAPLDRSSETRSVYRAPSGFRPSASPQPAESAGVSAPVSVRQLLDSATLALPDTTEFTLRPYHVRFTPDYVARPTVGYQRDNFGRGFFGGTAVALSDILGNHTIVLSGSVNGRISEAQFLGVFVNQAHRFNWATGFSQEPLYFYAGSTWSQVGYNGGADTADVLTTRIRRFVIRDGFVESYYPFSRFSRAELSLHLTAISDATLELKTPFITGTSVPICCQTFNTVSGGSITYAQPSVALVHDNALFGYVGPFAGSRSRFQVSPTFGTWRFTAGLADYRRYIFVRPFTLAVRGVMFGRFGRDAERFPIFLGTPELLRGYTYGSISTHECVANPGNTSTLTGCNQLDQLIGSKIAVGNVELRFPLTRSLVLGFLPVGFPPIEAALFYDAGLAWSEGSVVKLRRTAADSNLVQVRTPLRSWGTSIRVNVLGLMILRFDWTRPIDRSVLNGAPRSYWTISLGPTF